MMNKWKNLFIGVQMVDFVPAISGLIGKTALVTSFAVIWATELHISRTDFVFENVRIEMIIGSIITLLAAILWKDAAPSGTLAPFIVMVPTMAAFGVHPFILSLSVTIIGLLGIKTKLFHKLISLSGSISKVSLTICFGAAGAIMSIRKLMTFFQNNLAPAFFILISLIIIYLLLLKWNKIWLIIPVSALLSVTISVLYRHTPEAIASYTFPVFNPSYWWNDMWGIGYGFHIMTIIKTFPFALFVLLLWAIDTVSITAMLDSNYKPSEKKEEINLNRSFLITSFRNLLGGVFGGAQTGALWRSFLIPLFTVKRPLQPASILLGLLGIMAGFTSVPIKLLSFPPLIWSVLLFGIFLPFIVAGTKNLMQIPSKTSRIFALSSSLFGIFINPILTWFLSILFEKIVVKKPK